MLPQKSGYLFLMDSIPADPELLTRKALRIFRYAGAILCDEKAWNPVLFRIPASCKLVDIGAIGKAGWVRAAVLDLLQLHANVVLVGGFDCPGVDLLELVEFAIGNGIPYEYVQGVSGIQALTAAWGIPLTRRGLCESFVFLPGDAPHNDLRLAAQSTATVIIDGMAHTLPDVIEVFITSRGKTEPAGYTAMSPTRKDRLVPGTLDSLKRHCTNQTGRWLSIVIGKVVKESFVGNLPLEPRLQLPI